MGPEQTYSLVEEEACQRRYTSDKQRVAQPVSTEYPADHEDCWNQPEQPFGGCYAHKARGRRTGRTGIDRQEQALIQRFEQDCGPTGLTRLTGSYIPNL
ncbi:hypothetical protein BOSE62_200003 [Bosea sp. 62]|nr:hypothetical protein BOSE7B_160003 [Bosea sp. 7B]CAD5270777.1 hypothetical protein BOSE21B_140004 [Bosea sp. 21B]CAD5275347.1 hypothetical protein BOSE46_220003 [Bosea sp. 46]VVT60721.1 hypothetical protein BOS5A_220066 [Bosea sp. EC-HK365B]VXC05716.1 hypothetical protein BOSE29B_180002 [Bosea sp. 29B]VXC05806.1 hypothetical protein BOSE62_200003 [Bosea sp. 62]VXC60429.1 hypothetical protein BOSE127_240003 [Bosea sp. 127]